MQLWASCGKPNSMPLSFFGHLLKSLPWNWIGISCRGLGILHSSADRAHIFWDNSPLPRFNGVPQRAPSSKSTDLEAASPTMIEPSLPPRFGVSADNRLRKDPASSVTAPDSASLAPSNSFPNPQSPSNRSALARCPPSFHSAFWQSSILLRNFLSSSTMPHSKYPSRLLALKAMSFHSLINFWLASCISRCSL